MENRFGVKDFFLFLFLIAVVVLIALAMKQFDRQYGKVVAIQQQGDDQLRELVAIRRAIERGVQVSSTQNSGADSTQGPDPFASVRALANAGKYDQGDWLVENFGAPVAKITPLLSSDVYAAVLQARIMECLVYRDADTLAYVPLLATSWTTTDNTKDWQAYVDKRLPVPMTEAEILMESDCPPADHPDDRKQYVADRMKEGRRPIDIGAEPNCPPATIIDFKLRRGVTFSDGSPFTADDVVFTYDWTMNPNVDSPRDKQALDRIKSVVKNDDYDVVFNFKEPYFASFDLASGISVMSKKFYGSYTPEAFNNSVGLLIGTGPYRMPSPTDWTPNPGKIELVRNERYWGMPTSFDRLVFYQIESDATELVMYGNGELDSVGLQPEQYKLLLKKQDIMDRSNQFIYTSPIAGYTYIAWNEKKAGKATIFADKRVRQALTMLTDRQGICDNILLGFAQPAKGPFSPLSKQNDPSLKDWTYDPAAAKALLKQVGFEDRDGSGLLTLPDGTPFSFKLSYPSKNETTDRIMQYIKDCYASAGVHAELDPVDWTIIEERLKTRDYDAISLGWSAGLEDDIYQMFDSSQIQNEADNFMSYSSPEMDAAIRKARATVDEDQRMPIWHECQRILHEDQPYTFLIVRKSIRFFDKRIQNIHEAKLGLNFVGDWTMPMPWAVPTALQKYK